MSLFLFIFLLLSFIVFFIINFMRSDNEGFYFNIFKILSFVIVLVVGYSMIGTVTNNVCDSANISGTPLMAPFNVLIGCPIQSNQNIAVNTPEPSNSPRQLPGYTYNTETSTYDKIVNTSILDIPTNNNMAKSNYSIDSKDLDINDLEKI